MARRALTETEKEVLALVRQARLEGAAALATRLLERFALGAGTDYVRDGRSESDVYRATAAWLAPDRAQALGRYVRGDEP